MLFRRNTKILYRLKSQSGIALLEAIIAAVILAIGMAAALRSYSFSLNQFHELRIGKTIDQVEEGLKVAMFKNAKSYLDETIGQNSANCDADLDSQPTFDLSLKTISPDINLELFNQQAQADITSQTTPDWQQWPYQYLMSGSSTDLSAISFTQFAQALSRCRTTPAFYPNNPSAGNKPTAAKIGDVNGVVYFCIRQQPPGSVTQDPTQRPDTFSTTEPFLGEFTYVPIDSTTGKQVACDQYQSTLAKNQIIGTLYYNLYWQSSTARGPVYGYRSRVFASGI